MMRSMMLSGDVWSEGNRITIGRKQSLVHKILITTKGMLSTTVETQDMCCYRLIRQFERRGGGGLSLRRYIASRLCLVIIVFRIFCKTSRCCLIHIIEVVVAMTGFAVGALFFKFPLQLGMFVRFVWVYQGIMWSLK